MHLEEQSLDEIMANSELLVSCYYIIESAVSYMASDRFGQLLINAGQYDFVIWPVALKFCHRLLLLDQRQRGQLYTALKNGFTSILGFLQVSTFDPKNSISSTIPSPPGAFHDTQRAAAPFGKSPEEVFCLRDHPVGLQACISCCLSELHDVR